MPSSSTQLQTAGPHAVPKVFFPGQLLWELLPEGARGGIARVCLAGADGMITASGGIGAKTFSDAGNMAFLQRILPRRIGVHYHLRAGRADIVLSDDQHLVWRMCEKLVSEGSARPVPPLPEGGPLARGSLHDLLQFVSPASIRIFDVSPDNPHPSVEITSATSLCVDILKPVSRMAGACAA
jgi:hypothetical protein